MNDQRDDDVGLLVSEAKPSASSRRSSIARRQRYTLGELLVGHEALAAMADDLGAWETAPPVGNEIIGS